MDAREHLPAAPARFSALRTAAAAGRLLAVRTLRGAVDAVLPAQCLACDATVASPGALCAACWSEVDFLVPPVCVRCGGAFAFDTAPGAVCAPCLREPPPWERARAVMRYDDVSRRMVTGFKHGDRTHAAPAFGRWLARTGAELIAQADMVAPVPLHWRRLWRRRFNQSALLADAALAVAGRADAFVPDLLIRRRGTPSQGGLGAAARRRNVAGAFAVHSRHAGAVNGKRILLVDDVMTTGATAGACARALCAAGAAEVDVLVLARVDAPR